jgi:cardiolipin synthase
VQLLIDGPATFAAMFADLETARESILLETYIIEDRSIAQRLAALLVRKQAQGVRTMVMYDALGSLSTPGEYFDALRAGGVTVCAFNPVNPFSGAGRWKPTQRDHRKILVVDGKVAFTGGINISEVYSSGSFGRRQTRAKAAQNLKDGWRDTQIRVRGPAVAAFEALVREAWVSQGCGREWPTADATPATVRPASSLPAAAGSKVLQVLPSGSDGDESRIYSSLLSAIDASVRSVHITMAYFAPGADMIDALCEAARRGVDVVLILPSVSDFAPALHAGRSHYQALLEAGVKVHELQGSVLHAKTAVIDGVYSTVGSSNMDWRSFAGNNEVNAVVIGDDFGQDMEAMFRRDLAASLPVTLEQWRQRPGMQRAKEWAAGLFERWW